MVLFRVFLCLAFGVAALALRTGSALAEGAGWSVTAPIRHDIDATCAGYLKAKDVRAYQMTRYSTEGTSKGAWYASDDKRNEALMSGQKAIEFDFVKVWTRGSRVVGAEMTTASITGDGSNANSYCYVGGKLARGSAEVLDVSRDMTWSRARWFENGRTVIAEQLMPNSLVPKRTGATPPPPMEALAIATYATPQKLPYYAAFLKARAGKLPPLK